MGEVAIGGRHTAKRRIQIRQFVAKCGVQSKRQSDPFVPDNEDLSPAEVLNVRPVKLSFKAGYAEDSDVDVSDEILSAKINLDEADRFIAVLRVPSVSHVFHPTVKPRLLTPVDLEMFRKQSEKLERLRWEQAEDSSEHEEDTSEM
jgi:hypothetical protein